VQDYCKRNPLISFKFGVIIVNTNRNNLLTYSDRYGFGPTFHSPHHCRIGDFRRFAVLAFLIQSPAVFHVVQRNDNVMNPSHFGSAPADIREADLNPGSVLIEARCLVGSLPSVSTVWFDVCCHVVFLGRSLAGRC